MKANELRVGNLLSFSNMITKNEIVKVNAWFLRQLVHDPKVENPQLTGYYQPIPLTEEWLIRFGFNLDLNSELYNKSGFDVELLTKGVEFYLGEYGSYFLYVEHVHQLQNLYFALTGEELTLKK